MELKTFSTSGDSSASVEVSDATFAKDFNESLVHQVIVAYMAAGRSGTKAQKNRAAVRGGGVKPWRQKGTGRARAGTIRSPLWRGGGKTFAAVPRDYAQKVNRKMYRSAMRSILSELVRQDRLVVVEDFSVDSPKTKQLVSKLQGMGINNCLIVAEQVEENLLLSSRNLIDVDVCAGSRLNPVSLVRFDKVLITTAALKQVEEGLS